MARHCMERKQIFFIKYEISSTSSRFLVWSFFFFHILFSSDFIRLRQKLQFLPPTIEGLSARGEDKKENFLLRSFNDGHKLKWKWKWVFSYRRKYTLCRVCLLHVLVPESFDWLKKFHLPQERQETKLDSPHKWAVEEEVELEANESSESFSPVKYEDSLSNYNVELVSRLAGWVCTRVRAVRGKKKLKRKWIFNSKIRR